jgi:hypothetical protein
LSFLVHRVPSLQYVPFGLTGFEHCPVVRSHTPAEWQLSWAEQVTGLFPRQIPYWQVSVRVQALLSSQVEPFGFVGLLHTPVCGLQTPAEWHWSDAVHTFGVYTQPAAGSQVSTVHLL